jgi:hypothetical protein
MLVLCLLEEKQGITLKLILKKIGYEGMDHDRKQSRLL